MTERVLVEHMHRRQIDNLNALTPRQDRQPGGVLVAPTSKLLSQGTQPTLCLIYYAIGRTSIKLLSGLAGDRWWIEGLAHLGD